MAAETTRVAPVTQEAAAAMQAVEKKMDPIVVIPGGPKASVTVKAGSRAALLKQARGRGLKYLSVMSKAELGKIIATHSQMEIDSIIKRAKDRCQQRQKASE